MSYHPCTNIAGQRDFTDLWKLLWLPEMTNNWVDTIPFDPATTEKKYYKRRSGCSATELVFCTPLSLPGQYFLPSTNSRPNTNFTQELQQKMAKLAYTPLTTYTGPYKVLNCTDKHIIIKHGNNTVSIDWIRPTSIEKADPIAIRHISRFTRTITQCTRQHLQGNKPIPDIRSPSLKNLSNIFY